MLQTKRKRSSHGLDLPKGRKQKVGTNDIFAKGERLQKMVLRLVLSNISLNDPKISRECSVYLHMILNFSGPWSKDKKKVSCDRLQKILRRRMGE